jgi:hypothetical protein
LFSIAAITLLFSLLVYFSKQLSVSMFSHTLNNRGVPE